MVIWEIKFKEKNEENAIGAGWRKEHVRQFWLIKRVFQHKSKAKGKLPWIYAEMIEEGLRRRPACQTLRRVNLREAYSIWMDSDPSV